MQQFQIPLQIVLKLMQKDLKKHIKFFFQNHFRVSDNVSYLVLKYCKFFSFVVKVFFEMQVHYYVRKDTLVDGAIDIGFVIFFVVAKIDCLL